jgi:hypothetical protein
MGRLVGLIAVLAAVGCQHGNKAEFRRPTVEEFNAPPEEARYTNPPESKYVKRLEQKDLAASMGSNGSMGGFDPNGGGMGGNMGGAGMGGGGRR